MPSPLTHIAAGYAIYRIASSQLPVRDLGRFWKIPWPLVLAVAAAVLPDLDSILGWLLGDFGRYHNQGSHSLVSGLAATALLAGLVQVLNNFAKRVLEKKGSGASTARPRPLFFQHILSRCVPSGNKWDFRTWFILFLAAYESHVLLDAFTLGRGVMLLWPFSSQRFSPPFHLFYGLRWSDGLFSISHLWTFLSEAGLIAGVYCLVRVLRFVKKKFEAGTPPAVTENINYLSEK